MSFIKDPVMWKENMMTSFSTPSRSSSLTRKLKIFVEKTETGKQTVNHPQRRSVLLSPSLRFFTKDVSLSPAGLRPPLSFSKSKTSLMALQAQVANELGKNKIPYIPRHIYRLPALTRSIRIKIGKSIRVVCSVVHALQMSTNTLEN